MPAVEEVDLEPPQRLNKTEISEDEEDEPSVGELMRQELGWQYSSASYILGTFLLIALIGSYVW